MLLLLVALLVGLPLLWTVSVGALRELRRARTLDPRAGCQAWVTVLGLPGRRYRCATPTYAGTDRCRIHLAMQAPVPVESETTAGVELDEPQDVGRAIVLARIGVPVAVVTVVVLATLAVWVVSRL